jgi:hypothetical protein
MGVLAAPARSPRRLISSPSTSPVGGLPIRAGRRRVDAIRKQIVAPLPADFVGEFGWPSASRMREDLAVAGEPRRASSGARPRQA